MDFTTERLLLRQGAKLPFQMKSDHPDAISLVAWYMFELERNQPTIVHDYSNNGNHGLVSSRPSPAGYYAWDSDGLKFDGANEQWALDCGQTIPFDGNTFSVVVDLTFLPGWNNSFRRFFVYYAPTLWANNGSFGIVHAGGIDATFSMATPVTDFSRHVIAFTKRGSLFKVYQNGIEVYTNNTFGTYVNNGQNVFLGRGNDGFIEEANTKFHQARFYTRYLTPDEVRAMSDPIGKYELVQPLISMTGMGLPAAPVVSTGRSQVIWFM